MPEETCEKCLHPKWTVPRWEERIIFGSGMQDDARYVILIQTCTTCGFARIVS
jgi:hypothetical protein